MNVNPGSMNGFELRMENRDLPFESTMGDPGFFLSAKNPGMTYPLLFYLILIFDF